MVKEIGESSYKKVNNSVGVIFCARSTKRHLFLLRNSRTHEWGLPGGKIERGETLKQALQRECTEEIQYWPASAKLFPIQQFNSDDNKFIYHTFYCIVEEEFVPVLNNEHIGYAWVNNDIYPKPLHRGLFNTLNYNIIQQKIEIIHEAIN